MKKVDKLKIWTAFAVLMLFIASCDKPKVISLRTTSPANHFDMKDTTIYGITLQTDLLDSIRANNLSQDMAGSLQDPELGGTDANMYFQIRLQTLAPNLGKAPVLDSAFLYLTYMDTTHTGNLNTIQRWNVFALQDGLDNSIPYYTNTYIRPDFSGILGTYTGKFNPKDSVVKIRISNAYASKILAADSTLLSDNPSFMTVFKGLAILPDHSSLNGGEGALIHFNLNDPRTRLAIYYKTALTGAKEDTLKLVVGDAGVRVTNFSHTYSNNVLSRLGKQNVDRVYVQSTAGLKVRVNLPLSLRNFMRDSTTVVHEAQIVFPEYNVTKGFYFYEPAELYLYPRAADGSNEVSNADFSQTFIDQTFGDYGGGWRTNEKSYSFIITHHIQNLLNRYRKQSNYNTTGGLTYQGMNLFVPGDNPLTTRRIVLSTPNSPAGVAKPYLRLIYTKIAEK